MTEQEVVELMKASKSADEWNANVEKVKAACAGYPLFWGRAIRLSGLAAEVAASWGGNARLAVSRLPVEKSR